MARRAPLPAILLVALAAAGARGGRRAISLSAGAHGEATERAISLSAGAHAEATQREVSLSAGADAEATEREVSNSSGIAPASTPASFSGRSKFQARHRWSAGVILSLLASQAVRDVEAFPLGRPLGVNIAKSNPLHPDTVALPDRASKVGLAALGVRPGRGSTRADVTRLWPRRWIDVLSPPELVMKGKNSEVYKCKSRPSYGDFDVAIKQLKVSPELEESVKREIQNLETLSGRSMIEVFAYQPTFESDGRTTQFLIMMEAADGNLREKVFDNFEAGCISTSDKLQLIIDILRGLRRMHREGYIHRNIKPENIFVMQTIGIDRFHMRGKIGDLGNARTTAELRTGDPELFGTREYIAPEIWAGGKETAKRDVWGAGLILYELFLGQLPAFFQEERFKATPESLAEDPLRIAVPREFNIREDEGYSMLRERDPEVAALIASMLTRNRWFRPSSEKALQRAKKIAEEKGIKIRQPTFALLSARAQVALLSDGGG